MPQTLADYLEQAFRNAHFENDESRGPYSWNDYDDFIERTLSQLRIAGVRQKPNNCLLILQDGTQITIRPDDVTAEAEPSEPKEKPADNGDKDGYYGGQEEFPSSNIGGIFQEGTSGPEFRGGDWRQANTGGL